MTTDIDVTTGMPALPHDQRWSVDKSSNVWGGPTFYSVLLQKQEILTGPDKEETVELSWWDRHVRKLPRTRTVPGEKQLVWTTLESDYLKEPEPDSDGDPVPAPLTREGVLATAEKVLNAYNDRLAAKALENELLGDYPPKSL